MSDTKIPKTFVDRWNAMATDKTITSAELAELRTLAKATPEKEDDSFLDRLEELKSSPSSFPTDTTSLKIGLSSVIPREASNAEMLIDGVTVEFLKSATDTDSCTFTAHSGITRTACSANLSGTVYSRDFSSGIIAHDAQFDAATASRSSYELTPTKPKIDFQKIGYLYTGWSRANERDTHSHGVHYDLSITHPSIAAPFITPALRLDADLGISSPALSLAAGPGLRIGVPVFCEAYAHLMGAAQLLRTEGKTSTGTSVYSVLGAQAFFLYGEATFPVSGSDSLSRGKGFSLGLRSNF